VCQWPSKSDITGACALSSPSPKYRSALRDKPRIIKLAYVRPPPPKPGAIQYGSSAPPLSEMLAEAKALNRAELSTLYGAESAAIVNSLDALHALAAFHSWTFEGWADASPHPAHAVLFACFHKSLLSLHAAHELTLDGLYGVARPHLRHAFESLMIAKFCATAPEADVYDKWVDGLDLYFTNGLLKKLAHPATDEFVQAWGLLCQWSHATVLANQLSLDLYTTREESDVNLALIGVFIHFAHHLLNTHLLTPTIKYYAKRYGEDSANAQTKERLKASLALLRSDLWPGSRRLIRDFKATWRMK
jgi:hypothetical protein